MVKAMTSRPQPTMASRPADALLVTCAADIAGARHEVLPPRMIADGGITAARAAPP